MANPEHDPAGSDTGPAGFGVERLQELGGLMPGEPVEGDLTAAGLQGAEELQHGGELLT